MTLKNYPGAKSGSGIIQWLINNIPYHLRYFELFAGSAQLYQAKKKSKKSVLADIDKCVIDTLKRTTDIHFLMQDDAICGSFFEVINFFEFTHEDFIYLDPPYPKSSRRSERPIYKHELLEDGQHKDLLIIARKLEANVMISTRQNKLYDIMLHDWRKKKFETRGRHGTEVEVIYMNYPEPTILHQYDYLGNDYIDRQRIKRKVKRFYNKLQQLPPLEKHLFIQQLINNDLTAVQHFLSITDQK